MLIAIGSKEIGCYGIARRLENRMESITDDLGKVR
jgi:hypothetical protein